MKTQKIVKKVQKSPSKTKKPKSKENELKMRKLFFESFSKNGRGSQQLVTQLKSITNPLLIASTSRLHLKIDDQWEGGTQTRPREGDSDWPGGGGRREAPPMRLEFCGDMPGL